MVVFRCFRVSNYSWPLGQQWRFDLLPLPSNRPSLSPAQCSSLTSSCVLSCLVVYIRLYSSWTCAVSLFCIPPMYAPPPRAPHPSCRCALREDIGATRPLHCLGPLPPSAVAPVSSLSSLSLFIYPVSCVSSAISHPRDEFDSLRRDHSPLTVPVILLRQYASFSRMTRADGGRRWRAQPSASTVAMLSDGEGRRRLRP